MQTKGKTVQFEEDMKLEEKILEKEFKLTWTQVKECFKKSSRKKNSNRTAKKKCKKNIFKKQDKKSNIWLEQGLTQIKTSAIMSMIKKMTETGAWKKVRGFTKNSQYRSCKEQQETVKDLLAGCKMLASSEYPARHNRAVMVMNVAWTKEQDLLDQTVKWYQEKWNQASSYEVCNHTHMPPHMSKFT